MIAYTSAFAYRKQPSETPRSPLKQQRLLRGWSQQDVVDALRRLCSASGRCDVGVNVDQVRRWENGHCIPSPVYRKHLCVLYNLTADHLGFIEPLEVQP